MSRSAIDWSPDALRLRAHLLGMFRVTLGVNEAGPWQRPPAKRLCEFVLLSPGRLVAKEAAMEALWPQLSPAGAARALSQALSYARAALSAAGDEAAGLLNADRANIWAYSGGRLEVDLDLHIDALHRALGTGPGAERDNLLVAALGEESVLLADEPYAEWVLGPRERLEKLRQDARLALARDRARGMGVSGRAGVVEAWETCAAHDPANEEVANALVRAYAAQARHSLVELAYRRCVAALDGLGLRPSPALEQAYLAAATPAPPAQGRLWAPPVGHARAEERRLVSVLIAALGYPGSTGPEMPEEAQRQLVCSALASIIGHIEELGGTITSVTGGGLVALFGAPVSHENDPERALLAALRAVRSVNREPGQLTMRVGVETGPAVVGPLPGEGNYGAVGDVVGVAAALEAIAAPGSVLVGPATFAATEPLFEWGPTEEVSRSTSGKPMPSRYLGRPRARPLGEAGRRGPARSARLVGRQNELATLSRAVQETIDGKGSVVVVSGEPGLGKSRLVLECRKIFMAWAAAGSQRLPLWLEGRSSSVTSSQPYSLFRRLLSAWVGVHPEEDVERAWAALRRATKAVWAGAPADEQLAILGRVMGLPDERATLGAFSPQSLQRATFAALSELFSRLLRFGPTVLALEDLHWSDPTSLHVTAEICALAKTGRLLVIMTRRTAPEPAVAALETTLGGDDKQRFQMLELAPLPDQAGRQLVPSLLGSHAPDELVDAVLSGWEGNPLFLEERVAALRDSGALAWDGQSGWALDASAQVVIPEVLERLVRSRIDRLSNPARAAVIAASVLGLEFTASAVGAVSDLGGGALSALQEACAVGLLVESREEEAFRFRHALVQEASYRGLLSSQRRVLHGKAAWALEEASTNHAEEMAGVLGRHFALAGEAARAASYLELAGDVAIRAFANEEAALYYERALELLGNPEAGPAEMARVLLKLGDVYVNRAEPEKAALNFRQAAALAGSGGSLEVLAQAEARLALVEFEAGQPESAVGRLFRAREALAGTELQVEFARVSARLASILSLVGRHTEAIAEAAQALRLADELGLAAVSCQALNARGCALMFLTRLGDAEGALRAAVQTALNNNLGELALTSMNNLCDVLESLDRWGEALKLRHQELSLAERAGNRRMQLRSLVTRLPVLYMLGRWDEAVDAAEAADVKELQASPHVALHLVGLVPVLVGRGETEAASKLLERAVQPRQPNPEDRAHHALALAEVLVSQGSPLEALAALEPALGLRVELGLANSYYKRVLARSIDISLVLNDFQRAQQLLESVVSAESRAVTRWLRAQAARSFGRLAAATGQVEVAEKHFVKAEKALKELHATFDLAVVQTEHAESLIFCQAHRHPQIQRLLNGAATSFGSLGAYPWLERVQRPLGT